MQPMKRWAPLLVLFLVAANYGTTKADPPVVYAPLPQDLFRPVEVGATAPPTSRTPTVELWADESMEARPAPVAMPSPQRAPTKPRIAAIPHPPTPTFSSRSSVSGKASWYCKAGVSACHRSYPPGSMVAAACAPLRKAMGTNWRGRRVVVASAGRSVVVVLVDYCASTDKTIDLYAAPFSVLGALSRGVLPVSVGW